MSKYNEAVKMADDFSSDDWNTFDAVTSRVESMSDAERAELLDGVAVAMCAELPPAMRQGLAVGCKVAPRAVIETALESDADNGTDNAARLICAAFASALVRGECVARGLLS